MSEILTLDAKIDHDALRALVKDCVREMLAPLLQSLGIATSAPAHHYEPVVDPGLVGAVSAPKTRGRPRKEPGAAAVAPTKKPAAKVPGGDPLTEILEQVKAHPNGVTGENLRALLGWEKGLYTYHMRRAMEGKLLKRKGEKRATTYFPLLPQ